MPEISSDAKEVAHNRRQALKYVLDYYNKHQQLSGGMDDDWIRNSNQFNSLANIYTSSPPVQVAHFQH